MYYKNSGRIRMDNNALTEQQRQQVEQFQHQLGEILKRILNDLGRKEENDGSKKNGNAN